MTKKEVLDEAKLYYKKIVNTKNDHKAESKKSAGHLTFNIRNNVFAKSLLFLLGFSGIGALLTIIFKAPIFIALPSSILSGTFLGLGLTNLSHVLTLKSKGKKARGYAKMELDSYFSVMQNFYDKNFKKIITSNNENEISKEDLQNFIDQSYSFAKNYQNDMNKIIGKKILDRNKKDYKKIKNLSSKIDKTNKETVAKKINKIIQKNNKFTEPWCELYNNCGKVAKNLFLSTNKMNDKYNMPSDAQFYMDPCYLNKKVSQNLNIKYTSTATCKNLDTFDMDLDNQNVNNKKITVFNSLHERQILNDEIFSK